MDKHTPEEENGSTGKLSLPLEKGKQKKPKTYGLGLEVMKEGCVLAQTKYLLTREKPFLVR